MEDIHWSYTLFSTILLLTDFFIRVGLSLRVIMRKRPYGVSLAWLVVVLLVPFLGGIFYLLFGENRLPERRTARAKVSYETYLNWLKTLKTRAPVRWDQINPECGPLHRQAEALIGLPAMAGNQLTLIKSPEEIIGSIIEAIEKSETTCHLQFYIWQEGGRVEDVINALIRAAARGVTCRVLLDSIGSRDFLKSRQAAVMRKGGIKIQESLPAGIFNAFFSRIDIRNHRKLVVVDGKTAYTGSQNMVDPDVFKKDAGVGNWVDVMVKVEGPVVETMAGTFISDWILETDVGHLNAESMLQNVDALRTTGDMHPRPVIGDSAIQLVPSGPGLVPDAIHSLLLTTIYAARRELVMTTPYFIPDEPLLAALISAAQRGVTIKIIVPQKNDSILVKYASRARYEELANAGVQIYLFHGGLLHSKTITVDGDFSLFGSVNLDMRSFWLNFEATLFIYCKTFTEQLLSVQRGYLDQSIPLDLEAFSSRKTFEKFKENVILLVSPLL
jgi:cardiolipin synthase